MDKSLEEKIMEDIIKHIHSNRHLSNLGYDSMTTEMKNIFNSIACNPVSDRNV
jgi:hypothetical protein